MQIGYSKVRGHGLVALVLLCLRICTGTTGSESELGQRRPRRTIIGLEHQHILQKPVCCDARHGCALEGWEGYEDCVSGVFEHGL